jgi:hypothetical protein
MAKAQEWPGMTSAWLVTWLWPLVIAVPIIVLLYAQANGSDGIDEFFAMGFLSLLIIALFFKPLIALVAAAARVTSGALRNQNPYGCPVCGHNIHATPHRCPGCGARLMWGELPRENRRASGESPFHPSYVTF